MQIVLSLTALVRLVYEADGCVPRQIGARLLKGVVAVGARLTVFLIDVVFELFVGVSGVAAAVIELLDVGVGVRAEFDFRLRRDHLAENIELDLIGLAAVIVLDLFLEGISLLFDVPCL